MIEKNIQNYLTTNNFQGFNLKAVYFDMDGVLFDSMRYHAEAWEKAMNESGLPFTCYDAYLNEGSTGTATINSIFVKLNGREASEEEKKDIYALKTKYFEEFGEPLRMPYAYEVLHKLKEKGLKVMVVTGSAQPLLIESLTTHFPNIFTKQDIISAFDVTHGKPHPEPYLKALQKAGVQPWEAIVIENAPMGVQASSGAKIFTIGVNTGPLDPELLSNNGANLVLDSMQELYEKWDLLHVEKIYTKS
ncbi:MAG: HAD-IA family hydrolase [Paludibacteraceae bacterium]